MKRFKIKTILIATAWIALLLFVLMNCKINFSWDFTPRVLGEPATRWLHFSFEALDEKVEYLAIEPMEATR